MNKFDSFLYLSMEAFMTFRKASGVWSDGYEASLRYFDRYLVELYLNATELTQEMADNWCAKRASETNNSCRARVYPILTFIDYLRKREKTSVLQPSIPKYDKCSHIPHAFSEDELQKFFKACDSLKSEQNGIVIRSRNITIPVFFRLLYSSGIRICEARKLRVEDVDLEQGVLNIQDSKGLSQHYVALHHTMLDLMKKYAAAISKLYPNRKYFFPSRSGNSFHGHSWTGWNFEELWQNCGTSHAIPYDFRHNYAIENINGWLGKGFDFSKLVYLSKSMGHSDLESTKYYFSLVPALADIIEDLTGRDFDEMVPEVYYEES